MKCGFEKCPGYDHAPEVETDWDSYHEECWDEILHPASFEEAIKW